MKTDLNKLIEKALNFAVIKHKDQFREGTGIPYVAHVLDVLKQLARWDIKKSINNADIWVTALTHDTIEDSDTTEELLAVIFNEKVGRWVKALSFRKREIGETSEQYQTAKSAHFDQLEHEDVEVIVIKVADRICNTYDFMAEGNYGQKYYNRGKGIINAFYKRREDIAERFVGETTAKIELSILRLENDLISR